MQQCGDNSAGTDVIDQLQQIQQFMALQSGIQQHQDSSAKTDHRNPEATGLVQARVAHSDMSD
jgi:hypothetical protein